MRRFAALVDGLPRDAAVHRTEYGWSLQDELTVRLVELLGAWGKAFMLMQSGKRVQLPPTPEIVRPKVPEPLKRKVESDPAVIAAWFANHVKK